MEKLTKEPLANTGTLRQLIIRSIEFKNLIKGFEQWLRVFGFASSTIYYSPVYVRSFFYYIETNGIDKLSDISNNNIRLYMQELSRRENFRTGKGLSQNYMLNHLNAVKLFSRYVFESKGALLDSSYRFSQGQCTKKSWLSREDIAKLYMTCNPGKMGDINRAILGVYYGLGLRRTEGVSLDIADLHQNNNLVYVKNAKFKQVRFVPISTRIHNDLETYIIRYRNPILKRLGKQNEKALLITERGKRISGNAVYSRLQSLAESAGISTPLALHTLRHSIATHLMENGLNLESIALFLGHKSLESTQIYTHLVHKYN